jgi:glycosyltransferase 2 family protein
MKKESKYKKFNTKWLLNLVGLLILGLVLIRIDINKTWIILKEFKIIYLILAIVLVPLIIGLRAIRWKMIMKDQGINIKLIDCFQIYFVGVFIGQITPGKVGDIVKVFYVKKKGYSYGKAFVSVVLDRLFDILTLFFIGYITLIIFFSFDKNIQIMITSIGILIGILSLILLKIFMKKQLLVKNNGIRNILKIVYVKILPKKLKIKLKDNFSEFISDLRNLKLSVLWSAFIITIFAWTIYFFQIYLLAIGLGINISYLALMGTFSIATIITFIPISISGIGTRDATLVLCFGYLGLAGEKAIALSIMFIIVLVFTCLMGFFTWLKKPIPFKSIK